jgi:hypothetical protein
MTELQAIKGKPGIEVGKSIDIYVPVNAGVYRRVRGTVSRIVETADFAVVVVDSPNGKSLFKVA